MKAAAICFVVIFLVFASAQYSPKPRPYTPRQSLCVWPEEYRVWTLKCMYGRVERQVQHLMHYILKKGGWGVEEFARVLCSPYEVFKLRSHFREKSQRKLLREATVEADKCLRYLIKNTKNA
uniref:Pancreatic trypsin inhibitor n=1 Tax=Rhipicephalus zambeziensis TaxID=60191 RepID=A0A224YCG2_9ACAR